MDNNSILQASNYVDGEMSPQEQNDFELQLQSNDELRQYVEQYKQATAALKSGLVADDNLNELKHTLNNLNKAHFKADAKVVSFKKYARWIGGVAAILILGLIIYNPFKNNLYQEYSISSSMPISERGEGAQTNLEKAAAFYNKKQFAEAEKLLAVEYNAKPQNSLTAYYYSLTLIQTGNSVNARSILQNLYSGESVFKYDAAYSLALSYVKQNDNDNAKKWLKLVPAGTSNYTKAKQLESKL